MIDNKSIVGGGFLLSLGNNLILLLFEEENSRGLLLSLGEIGEGYSYSLCGQVA